MLHIVLMSKLPTLSVKKFIRKLNIEVKQACYINQNSFGIILFLTYYVH